MTDAPETPPTRKRGKAIVTAVALVVVLVAAAVAANVAGDDKDDQGATPTTGPVTAGDCDRPASLGAPPEVAADEPGAWKKLKLEAGTVCFTLIATTVDAAGVDSRTDFTLTGDLPAKEAQKRLRAEPELALAVTAGEGDTLKVAPKAPLQPGTVYRFTLAGAAGEAPLGQWSFQSKGTLAVVQTLPADRSTGVPLNTGIELTFSHDDVSVDPKLLSISPALEGRTEAHRRTLVFVPKALKPATLYTVTLKAGAAVPGSDQKISEDKVFRFETGTGERDPDARPPLITFTREVWESPTAEAPLVGLVSPGELEAAPRSMSFEVRRFAKVDDFVASVNALARIPDWSAYARASYAAGLDGLEKVATFEARLEKGGPAGELYARFPEPLPAGWYLVTTKSAAGTQAQAWLQVTDLAPYAAVSETKTVVWVNDLKTRKGAAGVPVRVAGSAAPELKAATGEDGVALFDTPKGLLRTTDGALGRETERAGNLIVGAAGGRQAVIPLSLSLAGASTFSFRENEFYGDPGRFWRALQTDRTLYRATDTINVWGLIRPRQGALGGEQVTVTVNGYDEEGGQLSVARTTLPRKPSGTFIGKLGLSGAEPGFYTVAAGIGDEGIATTLIEVRDFVKPGYRLDVVPSKRAVIRGDEIPYAVSATFFEGTPVPGARLTVAVDDGPAREIVTDGSGRATLTERTEAGETGYFGYDTFNVRPTAPEEGEITGSAEVRLFPAALTLQAEAERRGQEGVVRGNVFELDLVRANAGEGRELGGNADFAGPPAGGTEVKAEITETAYQKIETGEYYDFIAKTVQKSYRYEEVNGPPVVQTLTADERGRFELAFPAPADKTFRVKLSVTDAAGRVAVDEQYLGTGLLYPDFTYLDIEDFGPHQLGDQVNVTLTRGTEPLPEGGDNRYLFVKAQQGIRSFTTAAGPSFGFAYAEADIPSVSVLGVRFTGSTYDVASEPITTTFDSAERRLEVEIKPAQGRHAPGEEAQLAVKVTAGGKPVEGAEVLLSAVDERIYRLSETTYLDQADVLGDLYRPVVSGVLGGYASHIYPGTGPGGTGAESGEGGDGRSDFRDAVLFKTVRTGADGTAAAGFALPDDLTSWRVSGVAVTDDLRAGTGLALVPVGLPVFADLGMAESYLVDDRPVLRLRAFGDGLEAGDPVTLTLSAPSLLDAPIETKAAAFETVGVPLPELTEGRHQVKVTVTGGGKTDSLTRPLTVVRSRFTAPETRLSEVAAGKTWAPPAGAAGRLDLILTDHNRGRYYQDLVELAWGSGDRVDQALARDLADELLSEHFGEGTGLPSTFRGSPYQAEGGGIAILPFADQDLVVSARVAALAPDRFARQGLIRYFRGVLDDPKTPADRAFVALYGLAALREPVLAEVQANAGDESLGVTERLWTGLSAAALGDLDSGRALYRSVLEEAGQERGRAVRVNLATPEETAQASAMAAVLGALVGDALAPRLEAWALTNPPDDDLVVLERAAFLRAAVPRTPGEPVQVAYTFGGDRVTEELSRGESKVLALTAADLAKLNLEVESGTLGVAQRTQAVLDPATVKTDPALGLARKLPATVGVNDLVRVQLTPTAPAAKGRCHQVTDLLPSGLRAVSEPYRYGREGDKLDWPYAVDGQRVSFCAAGNNPIVYLARVTSAGSYTAEPALIRSGRDPAAVAITPASRLEIK